MRVLLVHEYYRERGGEDVAFETDSTLLEQAGHEVFRLTFHNSDIDISSQADAVKLYLSTIWSEDSAKRLEKTIAEQRPDIVHFHNVFPLASPAAFHAAAQQRVAVVNTLHNYRLVCPNASLFRDGHVCEDCLHVPLPWPSVLHACYHGSRSQTFAIASMLAFHRLRGTWSRDVDLFIASSHFLREKLIDGGLPASKISVRANAVSAPMDAPRQHGYAFLYVGRLAPNKGVATLLRAWQSNPDLPPLVIAGTGELQAAAQAANQGAGGRIEYLGALPHDEVFAVMKRAQALVFPSVWYENQPMTILEAFACALPVIASRIGAIPELVRDGETGLLFTPGDAADLAEKVKWAKANPQSMREMGARARKVYEDEYSAKRSIEVLVSLYEIALARAAVRHRSRSRQSTA